MDQQTAAAIGRPGTERLLRLLTWAESRVRAETESVKAARSAPEGPGLEGRGFGRYAGNGGAHGCFSSHAPLPRGEREEGLGGGTPSHIKAGVPEEIPTMCVQKEYSVNYAFRCLKTVDMYRDAKPGFDCVVDDAIKTRRVRAGCVDARVRETRGHRIRHRGSVPRCRDGACYGPLSANF